MLRIEKGKPWLFWPSNVCTTFPEFPGNRYITGVVDFEIELKFSINEFSDDEMSIMTILPNYTSIGIQDNMLKIALTHNDGIVYSVYNYDFIKNKIYTLKLNNKKDKYTNIYLNDFGTSIPYVIKSQREPHIIFGAGNFPKNGFNLNYSDINLHEFKLKVGETLVSHHDFSIFIHDKSFDKTDNCNFINRI